MRLFDELTGCFVMSIVMSCVDGGCDVQGLPQNPKRDLLKLTMSDIFRADYIMLSRNPWRNV